MATNDYFGKSFFGTVLGFGVQASNKCVSLGFLKKRLTLSSSTVFKMTNFTGFFVP